MLEARIRPGGTEGESVERAPGNISVKRRNYFMIPGLRLGDQRKKENGEHNYEKNLFSLFLVKI
jgi:hypothetical protein